MPPIDPALIHDRNERRAHDVAADFEHLGAVLARRGVSIDTITDRARRFGVAIPSWGVGTGGTRFARFPGPGEPRGIEEKLEDCAVVHQLGAATPTVSLHIPWDKPADAGALRELAQSYGLAFDAMNSNTFQDQPGQEHSYKFGSLTHTDPNVRRQAIAHNVECIEIGRQLGSQALTVWIADGGNFPGQLHFRSALDRYVESLRAIHEQLPRDWRMLLEHKLYEPAFYSTVVNDWGTSYWAASQVGERVQCLVDLGHHAPNVNIECVVARLLQVGKLGGFHFNDSKYGDDDLDSGSIAPFQLFLVFCELVDAELGARPVPGFDPAYMLDQSHNVTDPIESLIVSAGEVQRAYVKALLVDRDALRQAQDDNDAVLALKTLKDAFHVDVEPILQVARARDGGAYEPIDAYRASGYRDRKAAERGASAAGGGGIV